MNQISNFFLDWFSFTYKNESVDDLLEDFWNVFPELAVFRDEMFIVSGRNYSHGLCLDDDLTIRYDDWNTGKGVNVEVPAHGLEHFFDLFGLNDSDVTLIDVFRSLRDRGAVPSRMDLTFDDYSKTYSPSYYYSKFKNKSMVTNMRVCSMAHSGDGKGETFYLGDRRKRMIRIYDKNVQSGGEINAIRYEIELHATAARAMFNHFIDSEEIVYFGDILMSIFDIRRVNSKDSNKGRWEYNKQWYSFVKSSFSQSSIVVQPYKPERQLESIIEHAEHQGSAIGTAAAVHGWDKVVQAIMEKGLKPQQIKAIRAYASKNGLDDEQFLNDCMDRFYKRKNKLKGVVNF